MRALKTILIVLAVSACTSIAAVFAIDEWCRQRSVVMKIAAPMPVFARNPDLRWPQDTMLLLRGGSRLRVVDEHFSKHGSTLEIGLPDGRRGFVLGAAELVYDADADSIMARGGLVLHADTLPLCSNLVPQPCPAPNAAVRTERPASPNDCTDHGHHAGGHGLHLQAMVER